MRINPLNVLRGLGILLGGLALVGCIETHSPTRPVAAHYPPTTAEKPHLVSDKLPDGETTSVPDGQPAASIPEGNERPAEERPAEPTRKPPANDREPIEVGFNDLNLSMQPDVAFRPWMMTERVKELEGRRIKLKGYMLANDRTKHIKEFVLLKNTECKFGPGGQADHLAEIVMQKDATADFTTKPVEVEGVLRLTPFTGPDGNTWSIYKLEATVVRGF